MTKAKDEKPDEGARSFAVFVSQIDEGSFNSELSDAVRELVRNCNEFANRFERKGKGTMTVTLDFSVDSKGITAVTGGFKVKPPKFPKAESQFWLTAGGNLSLENPRQMRLPLREVAPPAPARDLPLDDAGPARTL